MIQTPQPSGQRTRVQVLILGVIWSASLAIVSMSSGCSYSNSSLRALSLSSMSCGCCEDLGHRLAARRAWNRGYAKCYRNHCDPAEVRAGFVDGWVKVCSGGNTCPPVFAPPKSCRIGGPRNAAAWFQGFPMGVIAAESCGRCAPDVLVNPEFLSCATVSNCNPGCQRCVAEFPCGVGADPMMMAPEYETGVEWAEPNHIHHDHQHPSVEPILESNENIEWFDEDAKSNLEDESAATDITDLVPSREVVEVDEPLTDEGQSVGLAQPIDWDAVEQLESKISPVQYEDR